MDTKNVTKCIVREKVLETITIASTKLCVMFIVYKRLNSNYLLKNTIFMLYTFHLYKIMYFLYFKKWLKSKYFKLTNIYI